MSTTPTAANRREAIPSRRVKEELSEPRHITIRLAAVREMQFGEHWVWRNGEEHYTAEALRLLADAYNREREEAAALVCRRLAAELDEQEKRARELVDFIARQPPTPADDPDTFGELERRGLA